MDIKILETVNTKVAVVRSDKIVINSVQDSLDLMANIRHNYECDKVIINKENISEDFFELKTGLAGEIMQKYVNYEMALAIVGEFEQYNSKSLNALIYESNKGNKILFKGTEQEAIESLCQG